MINEISYIWSTFCITSFHIWINFCMWLWWSLHIWRGQTSLEVLTAFDVAVWLSTIVAMHVHTHACHRDSRNATVPKNEPRKNQLASYSLRGATCHCHAAEGFATPRPQNRHVNCITPQWHTCRCRRSRTYTVHTPINKKS